MYSTQCMPGVPLYFTLLYIAARFHRKHPHYTSLWRYEHATRPRCLSVLASVAADTGLDLEKDLEKRKPNRKLVQNYFFSVPYMIRYFAASSPVVCSCLSWPDDLIFPFSSEDYQSILQVEA